MKVINSTWLVILLLLVCGSAANPDEADEREVFSALPNIRYVVSVDKSQRTELTPKQAADNAVRIVQVGGQYLWTTRSNRKVIHQVDGAFDLFVDPNGAGYIKIARAPNGKLTFFEHINFGLLTITYFGVADRLNP